MRIQRLAWKLGVFLRNKFTDISLLKRLHKAFLQISHLVIRRRHRVGEGGESQRKQGAVLPFADGGAKEDRQGALTQ